MKAVLLPYDSTEPLAVVEHNGVLLKSPAIEMPVWVRTADFANPETTDAVVGKIKLHIISERPVQVIVATADSVVLRLLRLAYSTWQERMTLQEEVPHREQMEEGLRAGRLRADVERVLEGR